MTADAQYWSPEQVRRWSVEQVLQHRLHGDIDSVVVQAQALERFVLGGVVAARDQEASPSSPVSRRCDFSASPVSADNTPSVSEPCSGHSLGTSFPTGFDLAREWRRKASETSRLDNRPIQPQSNESSRRQEAVRALDSSLQAFIKCVATLMMAKAEEADNASPPGTAA